MAKTIDPSLDEARETARPVPLLSVRDARTGEAVIVRGVGALAGSALRLKKGISLLKPLGAQALAKIDRHEAG